MEHVPALDGLRFVAFFAVYVSHAGAGSRLGRVTEYGALGVQVFFVLSGFLIGSILCRLREQQHVSLRRRLWVFYARRGLRIFPLYYAALLLLAPLVANGSRVFGSLADWPWHLTYLSNVRMVLLGRDLGGMSHFWSLCVEEHFYLLAPLCMLALSTRAISFGCVAIWVGCIVARAWFGSDYRSVSVLSPFQFDCLTVGIAGAILQREGSFLGVDGAVLRRVAWVSACAFAIVVASRHWPILLPVSALGPLQQTLFAFAALGLILHLWTAPRTAPSSLVARACSMKPVSYLGKISYGLYVWHFPILLATSEHLLGFMSRGRSIPGLALTIAVAALSWHALERPLNALKRYFTYLPAPGLRFTRAEGATG